MKLIEFENSVQRKTVAEEEDKLKNDVEFILVDDKKDDSTVSKDRKIQWICIFTMLLVNERKCYL